MDENWMTYTVRYVVEFKKRRTTKDALFRRVLDGVDASGGKVSIASTAQEITLMPRSAAAIDLRSTRTEAPAALDHKDH